MDLENVFSSLMLSTPNRFKYVDIDIDYFSVTQVECVLSLMNYHLIKEKGSK